MALNMKSIVALVASSALGFSVAQAAALTVAGEGAGMGQSGAQCTVSIKRDRNAGDFVVTRLVRDNGSCTCFVDTGPAKQGGNAEMSVLRILADKTCDNAPPAVKQTGTGGLGNGAAIAGGVAAVGGLAAGLAGGGSDSPGN